MEESREDAVWRALAHRTRREMLDVLRERPQSTGELVAALGQNRHAVLQHLNVLRDADLVLVVAQGRRRINHLNAVPIQRIHERWVSQYAAPWAAALVGLAHTVESTAPADPQPHEGHDVG